MYKHLLNAIVILIITTTSILAQTADTTNKLTSIVVKGIRASAEAPFTKTEITKEQLATTNTGVDLPILLNQVTNVVTQSDAGNGVGYTTMRVRGTDITRINVTLNGVPVNDAESQGTFFVNFADVASSTQSIQLQRGAGSSSNGVGAFGASMHINTLDLPNTQTYSATVNLSSFNTWKQTYKYATGLVNNKYILSTRLSRITSNGYIQRSASALMGGQVTAAYYITPKASLLFNYMGGTEVTEQAWNGVSQYIIDSARTYNELGLQSNGGYYNNQTDNYQQHYYQLLYNYTISNKLKLGITPFYTRGLGYYQEYKMQQYLPAYNLPAIQQDTLQIYNTDLTRRLWLNNHYYGVTANVTATTNKLQTVYGITVANYVGAHYGNVLWAQGLTVNPATRWYNLTANKQDLSSFVKMQYSVNNNLKLFTDLQYRHVQYNVYGFRDNPAITKKLKYNFFNPKIGATYIWQQATAQQKVYSSLAIAQKEPNRADLETNTNKEPLPEVLVNLETGYNFTSNKQTYTANVYYMRYTNQLVPTGAINDVGAYTRINVPKSYRAGIELEGMYTVHKYINLQANIALSTNKIQQYNYTIDNYDSGLVRTQVYNNTTIALSPSVVSGATIQATLFKNANSQLTISNMHKYVAKQYLDNTQNNTRQLPAYYTTDAWINYNTNIIKYNAQLKLGVINIGNTLYSPSGYTYGFISGGQEQYFNYYYPQAGARYSVGVTVSSK